MKRIISVALAFLLVFSLCACSAAKPQDMGEPLWNNPTSDNANTLPDANSGAQNGQTESTENTENTGNTGNTGSTEEKKPSGSTPSGEDKNDEPKNENPKLENTDTEIVSNHTPLTYDSLYQYSYLSANEKKFYDKLYAAALSGVNNLDIEALSLSKDAGLKVYAAFTADNPQFFYIAKHYSYVISQRKDILLEFTLYYSDGTIEDDFDDDGKPISTADRGKIKTQIVEFSNKITALLKHIPSNVSEVEKEKLIYDYVIDNVTYDSELAEEIKAGNDDIVTHCFSAYGALCEGLAVCEGYAKLFQYLCYQVGINATQVHGISGSNHMWNAVKIDGEWYMADPTWDDPDEAGLRYYKYFNVTSAELTADHTIDSEKLKVPACTATAAAFHKLFALSPVNNEMPANYKTAIDLAVKSKDKYLLIYRGTESADLSQFIDLQIYSPRSYFKQYIAEKGYNIALASQYLITKRYYYIPIK